MRKFVGIVFLYLALPACVSQSPHRIMPRPPDLSSDAAIDNYLIMHPEIDTILRETIQTGQLHIGLSGSELQELLGAPPKTSRAAFTDSVQVWEYVRGGQNIAFYLRGGVLISWGDTRYPNPFCCPTTKFEFQLGMEQDVSIVVFDVRGAPVDTLLSGVLPSGQYAPIWDGKTWSGDSAPVGVYFIQSKIGDSSTTKKVLLLK